MRPLNLTAKLKDTANASTPELSFQRKAVQDYHSRQAKVSQPSQHDLPPPLPFDSHPHVPRSNDTASTPQTKRAFSSITSDSDAEDQPEQRKFSECASLKLTSNFLCRHLQPENGLPWHPHRRPRESAPQS